MKTSQNPPIQRYSTTAIVLHWVLGLSIITAFAVGLIVEDMPLSPRKIMLLNWHKWAGVSILFLSGLRLLWRLTHRPPALPGAITQAMPAWQRIAHHGTHYLMYLLFFVVPLLGWAYSSAKGYPIVWFGVWPLPDLLPANKELAETIEPLHGLAAFTLIGLVVVHVGAALKHHFIDRDGLLARMRPGR